MSKSNFFYLPAQKPYDWGYIFGVMASDGSKPLNARCKSPAGESYYYPQVSLAVTDKEFVEAFLQAVYQVTGRQYAIGARMNRKSLMWNTTVCHTTFVEFLSTLTQWGTYTWKVPELVFANLDIARGFLAGYFDGDGTIEVSRSNTPRRRIAPRLKFNSVNLEGLQDVQRLLILFDVKSTLSTRPNRHVFTLHHLKISRKLDVIRYMNLIGISLNRKHKLLLDGIADYLQKTKWQDSSKKISAPLSQRMKE